ncbi:hypothetical protein CA267_014375 [Alteromonas pelagimontana]|uniref:Flagellar hook-length control protein-like C-terminal domain-containing protein n=1 Tax=Alteromonas pelagimontana TaxID=1858656 RepID=A0A6M4MGY9_9ALTE|nr:flagellar hook-length control protein FliK [Alteromonas pelagimontana]QJR81860.1 hypothetical protein CA267_014375 [Alteromonas pelagimontana]
MQQIATQRSDIATLPVDIEVPQEKGVSSESGSQFTDIMQRAGAEKRAEKGGQPHPSDNKRITEKAAIDRHAASSKSHRAELDKAAAQNQDAKQALADKNETDWLEYVDAVRKLQEKDNELSEESALGSAETDVEALVKQENDHLFVLPDGMTLQDASELKGDITSIPELLAKLQELLAQLDAEGATDATAGSGELSASAELEALAAALLNKMDANEATGKQTGLSTSELNSLITNLQSALSQGATGNNTADEESAENASALLDMLKAELAGKTANTAHSNANGSDTSASLNIDPNTANASITSASGVDAAMLSMQELSDEAKASAAEDLAEKVVALLPPSASEQQQQSVKTAVIAGINEIQDQLAQGREPGINLQDMIAQAMSEADITLTQQMNQSIEQQISQLNLGINAAQMAVEQANSARHQASADVAIQENNQIRSEASKSQQIQDGFEKPVNIHQPEGQQQLNEKIRWMLNSRNTMAEIRLDPPEMGSMQVRVNVSGDTASVNFIVQSPQAKDALAQAEPRLRELLAEQGIELGESVVQQESRQQGEDGDSGNRSGGSGGGFTEEEMSDTTVIEQPLTHRAQGGIDYYA